MPACNNLLFICNTYMQLITAIQIKTKLYKDARADLILSDHSVNSAKVSENIKACKVFDRIANVNSKHITYDQSKLSDLRDVLELTFGVGKKFKSILWKINSYDVIFYYNSHELMAAFAFNESIKNGVQPICMRFEEGIVSYDSMVSFEVSGRMKWICRMRKFFHKTNFLEATRTFYCYYPSLFPDKNRECHRIPHLTREDRDFVELINKIFGYQPEDNSYLQKYIFFASSSDIDGKMVGETELVLKLADMVGRENLLVKMHPRDDRDVYAQHGITVSRNSFIPWEVIQLNHDFSKHIFITLSSVSVFNAAAMLNDRISTYYLFPCVEGKNNELDQYCRFTLEKNVKKMQATGCLLESKIIEDIREIIK